MKFSIFPHQKNNLMRHEISNDNLTEFQDYTVYL